MGYLKLLKTKKPNKKGRSPVLLVSRIESGRSIPEYPIGALWVGGTTWTGGGTWSA